MSILTTAECRTLTGLPASDNAYIAAAIPAAQDMIERWCDRSFDQQEHYRWFPYQPTVVLPQWPVTKLIYVGTPAAAATMTVTSGDLGFEVMNTKFTVFSGFTGTDFTFAANPTLADLKVAVEAATASTMALELAGTVRCELLMPSSGTRLYGAQRVDVGCRIADGTDRVLEILEDSSFTSLMWTDMFPTAEFYLRWQAGYATAGMPQALKQACANIVKDLHDIQLHDGTLKSRTITNYSETMSDILADGRLVEKQEPLMRLFRRTTVVSP